MFKPPLPLRVETPAEWAEAALRDPGALLSDHAHNEKKAALTYLRIAEERFGDQVPGTLDRWLDIEANVIRSLPWRSVVH